MNDPSGIVAAAGAFKELYLCWHLNYNLGNRHQFLQHE